MHRFTKVGVYGLGAVGLIGAGLIFGYPLVTEGQAAACDANLFGNRFHACYFSWQGGGVDRVPPNIRARPFSQEDFSIPENVGSHQVFDFKGGGVWNSSRRRWEQVPVRSTGRPFSVSGIWRGVVKFNAGTYTFRMLSDDGVQLLVDGQERKRNWGDHGDTWDDVTMIFSEPGWHPIQLKWYQGGGGARLLFRWDHQPQICDTSFKQNNLHACYYEWKGGDVGNVPTSAAAVLGQHDVAIPELTDKFTAIDYRAESKWTCRHYGNWWCRWERSELPKSGKSEKVAGIWRGKVKLKAGLYDFHIISDDGIELLIDGQQKVSEWYDHSDIQRDPVVLFDSEGWHDIQLKWYQGGDGATLKFWWERNPEPTVSMHGWRGRKSEFSFGEDILMRGRASDADGIASVEFFEDKTRIGTGTLEKTSDGTVYDFTWQGEREPRAYTIKVIATDKRGAFAESANTYTFTVNKPPVPQVKSISIKDLDAQGRVFSNLATRTQTIVATVIFDQAAPVTATLNGTVMGDSNLRRRDTSQDLAIAKGATQATFTFKDIREGPHVLNIILKDTYNSQSTGSQNFSIEKPNQPPSKPSFTIPGVPSSQKTFFLPKDKDFSVAISNISDPDSTITKVALLVDGNEVSSADRNGIAEKMVLKWDNPTDGKHSINIRVQDSGSPRSFTVDGDAVSVEFNTTPSASMHGWRGRKSEFSFGEDILMRGRASDADGIASVEFFEDKTRIGTGTLEKTSDGTVYDFTWQGEREPRAYTIKVIATDKRGAFAESANTYTFTVNKPPVPQVKSIAIQNRDAQGVVLSNLETRRQTINVTAAFDRNAPVEATLAAQLVPKSGPQQTQNLKSARGSSLASLTFRDLPEGEYRLNIIFTDTYNSVSRGSIDFTIVKQNEPPVIDQFNIEGVIGQSHTVTRPAQFVLTIFAYDPDAIQPTLVLFRDEKVSSINPSIKKTKNRAGRDGYEYRYTIATAGDKGTSRYTVQASDGKLSSAVSSPLTITINNALPTVEFIEPEKVLTTDRTITVYADAADADGTIKEVTFRVAQSKKKDIFTSTARVRDFLPSAQQGRGFKLDSDKRYYAPSKSTQEGVGHLERDERAIGGFGSSDVGTVTFPSPGIYTITIVSKDNDDAASRESRKEVIINDIPVIREFLVMEGAEVLTSVGSRQQRVTLEARAEDAIGGIASVIFFNEKEEKIAELEPTQNNIYRHAISLDVRAGEYQFFVEPKDAHGEVGRRTRVQVKITKTNTLKVFPSSVTHIPGQQQGSYYVIPTDAARFGFGDLFDNVREPVEFFAGWQKLNMKRVQQNPPVYEWVDPLYGTHAIVAKLPHSRVVEQTPPITMTIHDVVQTRDEAVAATSRAAPYIYNLITKTERNGLVVLGQGQSSGSVPINVKVRSRGSRIRVVRIFERGNEAAGKNVRIPSQDRDPKKEVSLDFTFEGVTHGIHTFVATAMDEPGEVAEQRELPVIVAQYQSNATIDDYEKRYGVHYPVFTERRADGIAILKETAGKDADAQAKRPAVVQEEGTRVLKAEQKQVEQRRGAILQIQRAARNVLDRLWNLFRR